AHSLRVGVLAALAALLPDARVRLLPRVGDEVRKLGHLAAGVAVEFPDARRVELDAVEEVAVDVELELVDRRVAGADRARAPVAGQVELRLADVVAAADAEERAQPRVPAPRRVHEPPEERVRLVAEAEAGERLEREARVAEPRVPVVP